MSLPRQVPKRGPSPSSMAPKSLLQLSLEWEENGGLDGMDEDGQLPDSFKVRPGTRRHSNQSQHNRTTVSSHPPLKSPTDARGDGAYRR